MHSVIGISFIYLRGRRVFAFTRGNGMQSEIKKEPASVECGVDELNLAMINDTGSSGSLSEGHMLAVFLSHLTYFIANPHGRGWQRNEGLFLLHSFLSLDSSVAFSILRFGISAKRVSCEAFTQFHRTWRTRRCSGIRRTCPGQLHLLSRAFINTLIVGFRASP